MSRPVSPLLDEDLRKLFVRRVCDEVPGAHGHHFLGRLVFDNERLYSSVDRHDFHGYPGLEYLRRRGLDSVRDR